MFAVCVTIDISPGRMPDFLPALLENARASLGEPGCLRFDVLTDPDRPDAVFLYELYADPAGFDSHRETPHYRRFDDATAAMIRKKEVRTWRQVVG